MPFSRASIPAPNRLSLWTSLLTPILRSSGRALPIRQFATSQPLQARRKPQPPPEIAAKERPFRRYDKSVAPYPHGPARWFKQQNRGLYGGLTRKMIVQTSKGRNKGKTKRVWKPNVQYKRLWSQTFNRWIRVRVATKVLDQIDEEGGLDNYLLKDCPQRIRELGERGWLLRMRLMRTPAVQEMYKAQREALGVPAEGLPGIGNTVRVSQLSPDVLEEIKKDDSFEQAAEAMRARLQSLSVREPRRPQTSAPSRPDFSKLNTLSRKAKLYQQFGLSRKAISSQMARGKL